MRIDVACEVCGAMFLRPQEEIACCPACGWEVVDFMADSDSTGFSIDENK